ncbi:MAG: PEP-utilizing enzyme [Candidatus Moraniibacteriota bacterium]
MMSLEQIRKIGWYKQSGAGIPLTISSPFYSVSKRFYPRSGFLFPNDVAFSFRVGSGFLFFHFFDRDLAVQEAKKILRRSVSDPEFFPGLEYDFRRAARSVETLALGFSERDFSIDSLRESYAEFWEQTCRFWENSLFIDLLDPAEDEIVSFVFGTDAARITSKQKEILFSPDIPTHFQKEREALSTILERVKAEGDQTDVSDDLSTHASRYYWLKNDYEKTPFLDAEYYRAELARLFSDDEEAQKIRESVRRFRETLAVKEKLGVELSLSDDTLKRLAFVNWVTVFRDERKKFNQISNFVLVRTIGRIAETSDIDVERLKFLTPDEIPALLDGNTDIVPELFLRQKSGLMYFAHRTERFDLVHGPKVMEYYDIIEESLGQSETIEGSVASRGTAIGKAKIVLTQVDFSKLERGDVLVTSMTRPEFVPIMERAAAIVTDEGGITCHAAIVSRELGIPCVIGTQVATRKLHDGDVIEVDAIHGIVRKIS